MTNSVISEGVQDESMPGLPFLACQRIVLCRPSHPGNIGAVARAMKTMGLIHGTQLVLVNPLCDIDDVAVRRASGAADLLNHCHIVPDITVALAGCSGAFGLTVRARELGPEPMTPRAAVASSHALWLAGGASGGCSAFVFGNETNGLSNEELQHCRAEVSIPTNPDYGSLNLGAAVQIMTYLLREASGLPAENSSGATRYASPMATIDAVEGFYDQLVSALIVAGFHDPQRPRRLIPKIRRIFDRTHLEVDEVNILRGIVAALSGTQPPNKVD
jgi:tRNA/rRNA methyltransferase